MKKSDLKYFPDKKDTYSSTSTDSEIFEANSCNEKLNENYYNLENTIDEIMANQRSIVKQESAQGFISQVSSSHILIEKEREKEEKTSDQLYKLDESNPNPNIEKMILESTNENIKKQFTLLNNASEAISKSKGKNNESLKENSNTALKEKLDELMTQRSLLTEIRQLEIKNETGVITSQEKNKLAELDALEFKLEKENIERQHHKDNLLNEINKTNEKRSLDDSTIYEQPSKKRKHEDYEQEDKSNKKSVLDYADPSIEMPSYTDPED